MTDALLGRRAHFVLSTKSIGVLPNPRYVEGWPGIDELDQMPSFSIDGSCKLHDHHGMGRAAIDREAGQRSRKVSLSGIVDADRVKDLITYVEQRDTVSGAGADLHGRFLYWHEDQAEFWLGDVLLSDLSASIPYDGLAQISGVLEQHSPWLFGKWLEKPRVLTRSTYGNHFAATTAASRSSKVKGTLIRAGAEAGTGQPYFVCYRTSFTGQGAFRQVWRSPGMTAGWRGQVPTPRDDDAGQSEVGIWVAPIFPALTDYESFVADTTPDALVWGEEVGPQGPWSLTEGSGLAWKTE